MSKVSTINHVGPLSDSERHLSATRGVREVKAMCELRSEHYAIDDGVLPILDLHPSAEVRIDIEETGVKLFIGPREYEWPRGCPDVCSVRTGVYIPLDRPQKGDL